MASAESKRVLKANEARRLQSQIAFNYEDLRERCDEYVERIRRQTQQMIKDAHAEAASIRERAYAEARDEGYQRGMQDAEAEITKQADVLAEQKSSEKLDTVLPAVQQAAESLVQEQDRWVTEWQAAAIRVAVGIAEKLVQHELQVNPELAVDMISEALQLASGSPRVTLRLNPHDLKLLGDRADDVVRTMAACGQATLTPDESIGRGGCVVETQHGVIDARLETVLERITSELID